MSIRTKYIDLSYFRNVAGDDDEILKELIQMFIQQMPILHEEMKATFEQQNWEELTIAVHSAKGNMNQMGVFGLAEQLQEFELLVKSKTSIERYSSYIDEFEQTTQLVIEELTQILNTL